MQKILVILVLVLAAFYLGYQFYKKLFAKNSDCDGCAVGKATKPNDLRN